MMTFGLILFSIVISLSHAFKIPTNGGSSVRVRAGKAQIPNLSLSQAFKIPTSGSSVRVRKAKLPQDLRGIQECRATFSNPNAPKLRAERNFLSAKTLEENPDVVCIVLQERWPQNQILGTAEVKVDEKGGSIAGKVSNVYVRKSKQGSGLGRKLMEGVEEILAEDLDNLILTVDTNNKKAFQLYRKMGYEAHGVHNLSLVLWKTLGLTLRVEMSKTLARSLES